MGGVFMDIIDFAMTDTHILTSKNLTTLIGNERKHMRQVPEHVLDDLGDVGRGHSLTQPRALHLLSRDSPHLEVVRSHEDVGDALAHHAQDPLVEVLGGRGGHRVGDGGVDEAVDAADLVLKGERADVVLERVRNPSVLHPTQVQIG